MKRKERLASKSPLLILFILLLFGACIAWRISVVNEPQGNTGSAVVLDIIDGDTVDVSLDGKKERVRLIGIDAPEFSDEENHRECFSGESQRFLTTLISGKTVTLISDPTQADRDSYGRLLRYVYLPDTTNVNQKILEEGYAVEYEFKGVPYQQVREFQKAEKDAKAGGKGLWGEGLCR